MKNAKRRIFLSGLVVLITIAATTYANTDGYNGRFETDDGREMAFGLVASTSSRSPDAFYEALNNRAKASEEELERVQQETQSDISETQYLDVTGEIGSRSGRLFFNIVEPVDLSEREPLFSSDVGGTMYEFAYEITVDRYSPIRLTQRIGAGFETTTLFVRDAGRLVQRMRNSETLTVTVYDDGEIPIEHRFEIAGIQQTIDLILDGE